MKLEELRKLFSAEKADKPIQYAPSKIQYAKPKPIQYAPLGKPSGTLHEKSREIESTHADLRLYCQHCGGSDDVRLVDSRTQYERIKEDTTDPNADLLLCRSCAIAHHAYWDEMWNDYNRGRL